MAAELHQHVDAVLADGAVERRIVHGAGLHPAIAHGAEPARHGVRAAVGGGGECHQLPAGGHVAHEGRREESHGMGAQVAGEDADAEWALGVRVVARGFAVCTHGRFVAAMLLEHLLAVERQVVERQEQLPAERVLPRLLRQHAAHRDDRLLEAVGRRERGGAIEVHHRPVRHEPQAAVGHLDGAIGAVQVRERQHQAQHGLPVGGVGGQRTLVMLGRILVARHREQRVGQVVVHRGRTGCQAHGAGERMERLLRLSRLHEQHAHHGKRLEVVGRELQHQPHRRHRVPDAALASVVQRSLDGMLARHGALGGRSGAG